MHVNFSIRLNRLFLLQQNFAYGVLFKNFFNHNIPIKAKLINSVDQSEVA